MDPVCRAGRMVFPLEANPHVAAKERSTHSPLASFWLNRNGMVKLEHTPQDGTHGGEIREARGRHEAGGIGFHDIDHSASDIVYIYIHAGRLCIPLPHHHHPPLSACLLTPIQSRSPSKWFPSPPCSPQSAWPPPVCSRRHPTRFPPAQARPRPPAPTTASTSRGGPTTLRRRHTRTAPAGSTPSRGPETATLSAERDGTQAQTPGML